MKNWPFRLGLLVLSAAACHRLLLPRMRFWGATPEEIAGVLPGDEMSPCRVLSTHAITIKAPPSAVWPWLVQIGERRAGFYSYDWIERLMLGGRYIEGHSATRIHPELQDLKIGDKIRLGEPAFTAVPVTALEPQRHLGLGEGWHFILREAPGGTRLIVRMRAEGWLKPAFRNPLVRTIGGIVDYVAGEPLHFLMERGMLKGIARRAESPSPA